VARPVATEGNVRANSTLHAVAAGRGRPDAGGGAAGGRLHHLDRLGRFDGGHARDGGPSAATTPALAAAVPDGTGLADRVGGYAFVPSADTVAAGAPGVFTFRITGPDGHTVTSYQPYESKLVLCYVLRSDLTGFRSVDAAMRQDGVWSGPLPALPAGSYRAFVTFAAPDAGHGTPLVYELSRPFTVPGAAAGPVPPSPASTATVDGYTVTLAGSPARGRPAPLTVTVAKAGRPVESFDRYLDGYAQLTAFHAGDLARARIGSVGRIGPDGALSAEATFPEGGTWRVFAQFDLAGTVHTAAFTLTVPETG
jgi:hypothetical protein